MSVATTPERHAPLVLAALAAGKHVLCEKPLAPTLAEARRMAAAARASDRVAMIDHEFRWQPARARLKELLDEGFAGAPRTVTAVSHASLFADPETPPWSWWHQRARGGGWLLNAGTHVVDALRWWIGEVRSVAGYAAVAIPERRRARSDDYAAVDADDGFAALLEFASGARGVLHQTTLAVAGRANLIQVNGDRGVLAIDAEGRLLGARKGDAAPVPLEIPERSTAPLAAAAAAAAAAVGASATAAPAASGPGSQFTAMEIGPFVCLARELAAAIRDGRTREPSIADAVRTQEVCEAIELAGRERRWVDLPLP